MIDKLPQQFSNLFRKLGAVPMVCTLAAALFFGACATHHSQFGSKKPSLVKDDFSKPNLAQTVYLIGDAGNADEPASQKLLGQFRERLVQADSSSTLLFLGDNIYPSGMPNNGSPFRAQAEVKITQQLGLAKDFKGKTIFIPGNHDWYNGVDGLLEQGRFVSDYLKKKKSFLPRKGCGIDHIDLADNVAMIVVDSEWFLQDWDANPKVNEDCDIKTREQFFKELEGEINKNQNKVTLIAMHHPITSGGPHGGQFSLKAQLYPVKSPVPLPVVGTLMNVLRKTTGVSPEDLQNKKYNQLIKRVRTLIAGRPNVLLLSGHEHNLQYIEADGVKQVISGAGSKEQPARTLHDKDFSYGRLGYGVLDIQRNGAARLSFFGMDTKGKPALLFQNQPLWPTPKPQVREYKDVFGADKDTAIYTAKMTTKGAAYRFLWGTHYRKYYSMPIRAKAIRLDTIFGGLTPTLEGGGHQSMSLRLEDKQGREYVMRALRKSATKFLQSVNVFRDQSVEKDFRDTYVENFIMDFYTTAHPYTPFVVGKLSDKVGIRHSNPMLYYVPRQKTLGLFNENFGDGLYLIEERPSDQWKDLPSFGKPDKIVGTDDVLANLTSDEKYQIDESAYIRARLFDMLIGDWDRHQDQWRWAEYKENGKIIYRPIPRDRDQAFMKYDGALLSLLMNMPMLRHMRKYSANLHNVKWFNHTAYHLDLAFLKDATEKDWQREAEYLKTHLTDPSIDKAFETLPKEVRDKTIDKIKRELKSRRGHLGDYAHQYYRLLQKTVLIKGTDKKDKFVLTREGKSTHVQVYRVKKDGQQLVHDRVYTCPETKELWVYGLNDEDVFEVKGYGRKRIRIRALGGADNDTYLISSGKKVALYDFISNDQIENAGKADVNLSNEYEINTYDYKKPEYNIFAGYPLAGFNPDDGIKMGAVLNYTVNGFNRFPYTQKHSVRGNFYFATGGFELGYKGTFPHAIGKWNLLIDGLYTSPNFSINYFGFGNETVNYQESVGKNYNRVKIRSVKVSPALQWIGEMGGSFVARLGYERIQVAHTPGRYVWAPGAVNPEVFNYNNFGDVNAEYRYENYDNVSNPTLGMTFSLLGGYKMNIDQTDRHFPYAEAAFGITHPLSKDKRLVLATLARGKALFDDRFEFYQAPTVGGDSDMRGFRNQRFSGKQTFYHSTDVRFNLGKLRTGFVPATYGVFGGFDYGRAWLKDDPSDRWHKTFGGGLWLNGINLLTARLSYFSSTDGGRVVFGFGLGF